MSHQDIIDLTDDNPVPEEWEENPLALAKLGPPDLLLVIFIHGFKGDDETFGPFPDRLQHVLAQSIPNVKVECIIFPAYETKGKLDEAVNRFADWLVTLTVEREVANGEGGGAGKARIVLCGHSMGGLLAADTLIQMVDSRPDKAAPLWPRIIALIAFDTPYLGLHPFVFRNQAAKATEYAQAAWSLWQTFGTASGTSTPTTSTPAAPAAMAAAAAASTSGKAALPTQPPSIWARMAAPAAYAVGSALLAGGIGAAYMRRNDIVDGYGWVEGHMKYVGHLWNEEELNRRLKRILEVGKEMGVPFRTWYTYLPPKPPAFSQPRTFIIVPKTEAKAHFCAASNSLADNEIDAHTGMFTGKTNDGYYQLGLETAALIREAVMMGRGVYDTEGFTPGAGADKMEMG